MSIQERIKEIEVDQNRDLEDIYYLSKQARQIQPLLMPEIFRFSNYIEIYQGKEVPEHEQQPVSEDMLAHESAYVVDLLERHEALLEDVREGIEELEYCSTNLYIDGEVVRREDLMESLEDLVMDYEEDLQHAMRICSRAVEEEDITGPLEIKSKRTRREARREVQTESILPGNNYSQIFPAD